MMIMMMSEMYSYGIIMIEMYSYGVNLYLNQACPNLQSNGSEIRNEKTLSFCKERGREGRDKLKNE